MGASHSSLQIAGFIGGSHGICWTSGDAPDSCLRHVICTLSHVGWHPWWTCRICWVPRDPKWRNVQYHAENKGSPSLKSYLNPLASPSRQKSTMKVFARDCSINSERGARSPVSNPPKWVAGDCCHSLLTPKTNWRSTMIPYCNFCESWARCAGPCRGCHPDVASKGSGCSVGGGREGCVSPSGVAGRCEVRRRWRDDERRVDCSPVACAVAVRRNVIATRRTSLTLSPATAVVSRIPRSASTTSVARRRLSTTSRSALTLPPTSSSR